MTVVRVSTLEGTLGGEAKSALAESFTRTVLDVEVQADNDVVRQGVIVHFEALSPADWYLGGKSVADVDSFDRFFWITLHVMAGPWDDGMKAEIFQRFSKAIGEVETAGDPPRDYVWLSVHEVPDGAWGLNGDALRISAIEHLFSATRQGAIRRPVAERSP